MSEPSSTTTILLVDDSRAIRRILGRTLTEAGYLVVEAADGQEGLDVARRECPDLVLLDVDMPVLDGLSTLRLMHAEPALANIPVLFLTARTSGTDAAMGLSLGAQDYLRKPCEPTELLARVQGALAVSRLQEDLRSRTEFLDDLTTTDPLTSLGNRRRYDMWVAGTRQAHGADAPIAVALADIDHFKHVNDTHGHLTGDDVLRIVAKRIRAAVGDQATIVRWGGEEFLVLQTGEQPRPITELGEALRASVGSQPLSIGVDSALAVTISVGCATGTVASIVETIEAADSALYEAKQAGRNCVVTH